MSRIVWIVNTHYQLIAALRMRLSEQKDDDVTLLLTDQTDRGGRLAGAVRREGLFTAVEAVQTRGVCRDSWRSGGLGKIARMCGGGGELFSGIPALQRPADALYYHNLDIASHLLFALLSKRNPALRCVRFEEGLFSYRSPEDVSAKFRAAVYLPRALLAKPNLADRTEAFLCGDPAIYPGRLPARLLPAAPDKAAFAALLARLFGIEEGSLSRPQRYLYFSGAFDFEGGAPIGEIDLIGRVAEHVGKENLLVKVHPRDDPARFTARGLAVEAHSDAPWEALRTVFDLRGHVLLTALSQSVLPDEAAADAPPVVFLYRLCDLTGNRDAMSAEAHLERLLEQHRALLPENLIVADSLGDLP